MSTFKSATCASVEEAKTVIIGLPTDQGARSERKGREEGPPALRRVSRILYAPETGKDNPYVHDAGDLILPGTAPIEQNLTTIADRVYQYASQNKQVILLGGDCSVKHGATQGLNRLNKKIGIVYIAAHPGCVESAVPYFGSVMADNLNLSNVNPEDCILVGARSIENREYDFMKRNGLHSVSALDFYRQGVVAVAHRIAVIMAKVDIVQLSIDIDAIDPSFAPGVGCPVPGGITPIRMLDLITRLKKLPVASLEIAEYIPKFDDINDATAQLICRMVQEWTAI